MWFSVRSLMHMPEWKVCMSMLLYRILLLLATVVPAVCLHARAGRYTYFGDGTVFYEVLWYKINYYGIE